MPGLILPKHKVATQRIPEYDVDEVQLREPRLMVPNQRPVGRCRIAPGWEDGCRTFIYPDVDISTIGRLRNATKTHDAATRRGGVWSFSNAANSGIQWSTPLHSSAPTSQILAARFMAASEARMAVFFGDRIGGGAYHQTVLTLNGYITELGSTVNSAGTVGAFSLGATISNAHFTGIVDGKWHTLVALFINGSTVSLFVDGLKVTATTVNTVTVGYNASQKTAIGQQPDSAGTVNLTGDIAAAVSIVNSKNPETKALELSRDIFAPVIPA